MNAPRPTPSPFVAPVTDQVLDRLIALWREPDATLDMPAADFVARATPAALEELAAWRRLLATATGQALMEGALETGNVVLFPASARQLPQPANTARQPRPEPVA